MLGELSFRLGDLEGAAMYLASFVSRNTSGRVVLAVSLEAELNRAQAMLDELKLGTRDSAG